MEIYLEILENLFVYGTLMKGEVNHSNIENGRFIGKGSTVYNYCMYDLGEIPYVTVDEVTPIHGEIWRITKDTLIQVDMLESGLFKRNITPIKLEGSGVIPSWMYFVKRDDLCGRMIHKGSWR